MAHPTDATVMVVEDEYLIAVGLEMALQGAGYTVLEPLPSVEQALAAVALQTADLALLDINVAGHRVYPVADALAARKVPFIFLSGCGEGDVPPRFSDIPILTKPFQMERLFQSIRLTLENMERVKGIEPSS